MHLTRPVRKPGGGTSPEDDSVMHLAWCVPRMVSKSFWDAERCEVTRGEHDLQTRYVMIGVTPIDPSDEER
jgi:hypothetical protein